MASSLVGELPLILSQYACLVGLVVFLAANIAPDHGHGLAFSSGQLLEASSEHGDHHAARHTSVQFPAKTVSSDDVLVFQTSESLLCLFTKPVFPPSEHAPPAHVVIASPTQAGTYPVILFKHGFLLPNCFYTKLFELLAASGYIVVAPQFYSFSSDCTPEIEQTAAVANWVSSSLQIVLNVSIPFGNVVPDMSKFVMAGHSRGGKIAFAMVLGKAPMEVPSFSALVALDPVDCFGIHHPSEPSLVTPRCNHTSNQIAVPVLILGTGYGSEGCIPCASTGCNYAAYFNCSSAPIMYQLVASDYGHLNFLDVFNQHLTHPICKSGRIGASLYDFSGEVILAFLDYALNDNDDTMEDLVDDWESASIKLEKPQVYEAE